MNLLLLNQYFPPDTAPTGVFLSDLSETLVQRGHRVTVLCSSGTYEGGRRIEVTRGPSGLRVRRVPATALGRLRAVGAALDYASFALLASVLTVLDSTRPHLILSLTTPPYLGLVAQLAARLHGCRHAHWIMDVYPDALVAAGRLRQRSFAGRALRMLAKAQFSDASFVVTLGGRARRRLAPYCTPRVPLHSIPLWATEDMTPWPENVPIPLRKERGWRQDELVLMYSGNMGLGHRFEEFLNAAAQLREENLRWVFAGAGRRRAEVEAHLTTCANSHVELQSSIDRRRLRESLSSADVHLISMREDWEGVIVPSKFQNIMAVGRPVIFVGGQDNEIAQWIRESGAGWCVKPGDLEGLASAIHESRSLELRRRMGEAAVRFAARHFRREVNLDALACLIEGGAHGPTTGP